MQYYIYVPQGRTVRITQASSLIGMDIVGAFINHFSFCHMVILIGKQGISVTHADFRVKTNDIEKEIDWLGADCEKILLYRNDAQKQICKEHSDAEMSKNSHNFLFYIWSKKVQTHVKDWKRISVDDNIDPIIVHLNPSTPSTLSTLHPNLVPLGMGQKPEHLLNHPQELNFTAAHKIEEMLFFNTSTPIRKQALIFDGKHWLPIPKEELEARHPDKKIITEYLSKVLSDRTVMGIAVRLLSIRKKIREKIGHEIRLVDESFDTALTAAKYFQHYDTNMTPTDIYCRDLEDTLKEHQSILKVNSNKYPIQTAKDRSFYNQLTSFLKNSNFLKIEQLIEEYIKDSDFTDFKKYIMASYRDLIKPHYLERMQCLNANELYEKQKLSIETMGKEFKQLWPQYNKAFEILKKMFKQSWCYEESDKNLTVLYGNMGTCLYYLQRFEEAIPFLKKSIELRKQYNSLMDSLHKLEQKLKECQENSKAMDTKEEVEPSLISKQKSLVSQDLLSKEIAAKNPKEAGDEKSSEFLPQFTSANETSNVDDSSAKHQAKRIRVEGQKGH